MRVVVLRAAGIVVWCSDDSAVTRSFDELVSEVAAADVTGWGLDWLNGRATEQRPPWGYAKLLADRLGRVKSPLDIDTGGGDVLAVARRIRSSSSASLPRCFSTEKSGTYQTHLRRIHTKGARPAA